MPRIGEFDFDQIRFEPDAMGAFSVSVSNKDVELPLVRCPINFAVLWRNGKVSSRWGVRTSKKGDVYVVCRDVSDSQGPKASLHADGWQFTSVHPKYTSDTGRQFFQKWERPGFDGGAIATLSILFPPWAGADIDLTKVEQRKDELFVLGHHERIVVVGFCLVDSAIEIQPSIPHIVLGKLSLMTGETLYVVAWKEPLAEDLPERLRRHFPQIASALQEAGRKAGGFTLCLHGYRRPNSAYMMPMSVHYQPNG
ncbi:MAG: hypothetical protein F4Y07_02625 [Gemmatimonadetes bacterium]|nr:hypothetical protein [Gemmatimonadota bacterium]MYE15352.1 hypothetical protein [Gemmatimonadota bacterium]